MVLKLLTLGTFCYEIPLLSLHYDYKFGLFFNFLLLADTVQSYKITLPASPSPHVVDVRRGISWVANTL